MVKSIDLLCSLETVDAIIAKQKLLDKQRQDIEEIERNADREVSRDHATQYYFDVRQICSC